MKQSRKLGGASMIKTMTRLIHVHLLKPEFLWRPSQVLRRVSFRPSADLKPLPLPWGCTINACTAELIGRFIAKHGVYDLPLTEAALRLTDAGDVAVDVGANIGYMTLVLALSSGPEGRVCCFEPNPDLVPILRKNVSNWCSPQFAPIQIETVALSDRNGEGVLGYPDDYASNKGLASLEFKNGGVSVKLRRLDAVNEVGPIGIMKVDVEGHEASVLMGAEKLLSRKLVRDILFEEHEAYPAPSHKVLLGHGYQIFRVSGSIWRPLLLQPEAPPRQTFLPPNYPPNFLATKDPDRARARFSCGGWYALSAASRSDLRSTQGKRDAVRVGAASV
jgi:FkbM family methyltransferase